MKGILGIIIILLMVGCVEYQLSGNEKIACLNSTDVTLTGIPVCEKNTSCQEIIEKETGTNGFHWLPIGMEWEKTKNHVVETWVGLNESRAALKHTNGVCKKGNVLELWSSGITSAAAIQKGLKGSEKANEYSLKALTKAVQAGEKWDLIRVKDSDAFHAYANLLETVEGITVMDPQNENAGEWVKNQAYFEGLNQVLTQNQASGNSIDWKSAFQLYKTGIQIGLPNQAKTIITFSPIWQGLISSFTNEKKASQSLSVLQYINAPQMVEKISETVRLQNGVVPKIMKSLRALEEGMKKLEKEEEELEEIIEFKMEIIQGKVSEIKMEMVEMKKWEGKMGKWGKIVGIPFPENTKHFESFESSWNNLKEEWNNAQEGKTLDQVPIGKRVEVQRNIIRGLETLGYALEEAERVLESQMNACKKIGESGGKEHSTEGDIYSYSDVCEGVYTELEKNAPEKMEEEYIEAVLIECVNGLNEWNKGLGVNTEYGVESFIESFGASAGSACESAVQHVETEYENQFGIQEIMKGINTLNEWVETIEGLPDGEEKGELLEELKSILPSVNEIVQNGGKQPIPFDEQEGKQKEIENFMKEMEKALGKQWIKSAQKQKWKLESNEPIFSNQWIPGNWKMDLANMFETELNHPFTIEWESEIEWDYIESSSGEIQISGKKVALKGDHIPEKGIQLSGNGKGEVVKEKVEWDEILVMGNSAKIREKRVLDTQWSPIAVEWKWSVPPGVEKENVVMEGDGEIIEMEWVGNQGKSTVILTKLQTILNVDYFWEGIATMQITLAQSNEQLGQKTDEYHVEVLNNTPHPIEINVDTGISADPFKTQEVWITDESGNMVSFSLSPLFSVIMDKIKMVGNEKRFFHITIVRPEGSEVLEGLIQTLLDELKPLLDFSDNQIAAKANQLIHKIENGLATKNLDTISAALPGWTNEVNVLMKEAEMIEEKIAENAAEWIEIKESISKKEEWTNDTLVEMWIQKGNEAQKKENYSSLEKIIHDTKEWMGNNEKMEEEGENDTGKFESISQEIDNVITLAEKITNDLKSYEKNQAIPCSQLKEVGFVCPISEEQQSKIRNEIKEGVKEVKKWKEEMKKEKTMEKGRTSEIERGTTEWIERWERNEEQIQRGIIALQKTAHTLLNQLEKSSAENSDENVKNAIQKARNVFENGEYGKTIFIVQNMIQFLKGKNPLTGLGAFPAEGFPLIGIAVAGVAYYGYRKWKEKNKPIIIPQSVPKDETIREKNEERE